MRSAIALLFVGAFLGSVGVASAAPLTVSELLGDSDRFNGQPVTVKGTIADFRDSTTRHGTRRYQFHLGDGAQIVNVLTYTKPSCGIGPAMVEGTFSKWKMKVLYAYEITARNVICLPKAAGL